LEGMHNDAPEPNQRKIGGGGEMGLCEAKSKGSTRLVGTGSKKVKETLEGESEGQRPEADQKGGGDCCPVLREETRCDGSQTKLGGVVHI